MVQPPRRLYEQCGDIRRIDLENAYYAQQRGLASLFHEGLEMTA
jgi:hypothetical protein